ncbi:hypothetical protein AB833_25990 [Chromatiales bacterium (ex Bugula neritina AB1)]|nr:hypothetical protein AB833_25990 [Chromatiales bacterium (ex Bugula neritina AB1)]
MSDTSPSDIRQAERFRDDTSSRGEDAVDLRGIIITLRKYKWPIILTTALATAITALVVSSITPEYRSTATLLFEDGKTKTGFENPFVEFGQSKQDIQTQVEVLKSRTLAERVVVELDLKSHWEYNRLLPVPDQYQDVGPLSKLRKQVKSLLPAGSDPASEILAADEQYLQDQMVRKLMDRTSVFPLKQTNLVKVSVDGVDRILATRIANGIGDAYVSYQLEKSDGRNSEAKAFLQSKVDELKVKLEEAEQSLLAERRLVGISGDGGDYLNQTIALFNNRLVDAKTNLEVARIQWNEVRTVQALPASTNGQVTLAEVGGSAEVLSGYQYVGTAAEVLPVVDSNPLVQRNKQLVQESRRQLDELRNRYGRKHPRVVDALSNLETATGNLDRQIANVISSTEKEFLAAQRQVRSIEADIRREEQKQYSMSEGRVAIKEVELTRDSTKRYYEEALSELRDYQEKDLQSVPMAISDMAAIPETPVRPKKTLMVMLGFLLSLFGISSLLFAYESMKETVQGINDVEKKLGIPVFGIVPVIKSSLFGRKTVPLIPGEFDDKRGAFEEAIRTIRTSATVTDLEQHQQVIMVTSSVPGEGKSTVASNLAYSMSKLENVVLIEADMRRPGLGKALGIKTHGLSDLLEGESYLEDCMRFDAIGKLDIIPAGRIPESHLELLASPEFAELIDLLKSRYDRVVIDLAPVQAVSDAIVVGKYADSAIFVIKADSTAMPVVRRGVDRLREVGINVAGAVISQVDLSKISSYGGDYYYQGYYDYYGYGDSASKSRKRQKKPLVRDDSTFAAQSRRREEKRDAKKISDLRDRRERRDPSIGGDTVA